MARLAEAWRLVFWEEMASRGLGHLGMGAFDSACAVCVCVCVCVCLSHLFYPFTYQLILGLFPYPGCCKYYFSKHRGTYILLNLSFHFIFFKFILIPVS